MAQTTVEIYVHDCYHESSRKILSHRSILTPPVPEVLLSAGADDRNYPPAIIAGYNRTALAALHAPLVGNAISEDRIKSAAMRDDPALLSKFPVFTGQWNYYQTDRNVVLRAVREKFGLSPVECCDVITANVKQGLQEPGSIYMLYFNTYEEAAKCVRQNATHTQAEMFNEAVIRGAVQITFAHSTYDPDQKIKKIMEYNARRGLKPRDPHVYLKRTDRSWYQPKTAPIW